MESDTIQAQLIVALNIPQVHVIRPKVTDIHIAYAKYQAYLKAQTGMH